MMTVSKVLFCCLALVCLFSVTYAKVEGIVALPLTSTTKGQFDQQNEKLLYRTDLASINEKQDYFIQYAVQSDGPVCVYVRYAIPPSINPPRYLTMHCTNSTHKQITFGVETHLFQAGGWLTTVENQNSGATTFEMTAFNTTKNPNNPPPSVCPIRASTWAAAGPYKWEGYCWYLGNNGRSCDAVCKGMGGSNLASFAQHQFTRRCETSSTCNSQSDEPIVYFYNNGNPYNWKTVLPSREHNLGYGLWNSRVDCHCLTGPASESRGSFPGQANPQANQALACPCFDVSKN